jgi:low temperature requirement protein LtrA
MKTYLHSTTEAKYQVECGLLLTIIIGESVSILKLLASEDQMLDTSILASTYFANVVASCTFFINYVIHFENTEERFT